MCLMTKTGYNRVCVCAIIISINPVMCHTLKKVNNYFSDINCFAYFNMLEVCLGFEMD